LKLIRSDSFEGLNKAMKRLGLTLVLALGISASFHGYSQEPDKSCRIMFYNVENFFDPFDDTITRDEEFTPGGEKGWTYSRFMEKAVRIARVIIACGDPEPPVIVGLAEVENRFVLEKLVFDTPLRVLNYKIVHQDSPDRRGIDVALLYRREMVKVDTFYFARVQTEDTSYRTREILISRCVLFGSDTMTVAVNHWPSRYGGAAGSEQKRMAAAWQLKQEMDRLINVHCQKNILIMGDFNDEPGDNSLQVLSASLPQENNESPVRFINLMPPVISPSHVGTIKHEGLWCMFDQILVSEELYHGVEGLAIRNKKAAVFNAAFLLEVDNSHLGRKPFRTFQGPAYHKGYSDHLPVFTDVLID